MRKPTLRTALKLQSSRQNQFSKVKRYVSQQLGVPVGFSSPVLLDMFDGKTATYRMKGNSKFQKMVVPASVLN